MGVEGKCSGYFSLSITIVGLLHLFAILVVVLHTVVCCCSMIYSNKGVKKRDETLMIPVGGSGSLQQQVARGGKKRNINIKTEYK